MNFRLQKNGLSVIINDESFFTLLGSDSANKHYYCIKDKKVYCEVNYYKRYTFLTEIIGIGCNFF